MVDRAEWFENFDRKPGEGVPKSWVDWKMNNVHDFQKWIADNKDKTDEGLQALKSVMSIGNDVASAAIVKRLRDTGFSQAEVAGMADSICDKVLDECVAGRESVIRDCASIFAGTGNTLLVMMIAFVSYSLIGFKIADELASSRE
jgi:hypothetical protein